MVTQLDSLVVYFLPTDAAAYLQLFTAEYLQLCTLLGSGKQSCFGLINPVGMWEKIHFLHRFNNSVIIELVFQLSPSF